MQCPPGRLFPAYPNTSQRHNCSSRLEAGLSPALLFSGSSGVEASSGSAVSGRRDNEKRELVPINIHAYLLLLRTTLHATRLGTDLQGG